MARTAFDLGRLLPDTEAVPILDALMNKTGLDPEEVWSMVEANRGIRGNFTKTYTFDTGRRASTLLRASADPE